MTYQTNVPNASQSPALFPAQANTNFTRLKTIIGANHKFNDSVASDDGYHQIIKILPTATVNVPNDATVGQSFVNSANAQNQLYHKDALNRIFQITPTIPIYAAVNFVGASASMRFSHNVTSVTRSSAGVYTLNFTTALPSNNYIVTGMCMRDVTNGGVIQIFPNSNYNQEVQTTQLSIMTVSIDSNTPRDMVAVFVSVMGG